MYDFVEYNLPHSFGYVFRYNRDVQNIHRTRCHTKFSQNPLSY